MQAQTLLFEFQDSIFDLVSGGAEYKGIIALVIHAFVLLTEKCLDVLIHYIT